jgi:hypothetical protein
MQINDYPENYDRIIEYYDGEFTTFYSSDEDDYAVVGKVIAGKAPENAILGLGRDILRLIIDQLVVPRTPFLNLCKHKRPKEEICDVCRDAVRYKYNNVISSELIANNCAILSERSQRSAKYLGQKFSSLGLPPESHRLIWVVQLMMTCRTMRNLVLGWRRLHGHQRIMSIETTIRHKAEVVLMKRQATKHAIFLANQLTIVLGAQLRLVPGMRLRIIDHSLSKKFEYCDREISVGTLMKQRLMSHVLLNVQHYIYCDLQVKIEWTLEPPTVCKHDGVMGCKAAHCQHIVWWATLMAPAHFDGWVQVRPKKK